MYATTNNAINNILTPSGEKTTFSDFIMQIAATYNQRGSININDTVFDFSNCEGKIEFAIAGHVHGDYINTVSGIPVICTLYALANNDYPSFDLVFADYDSRTIELVRVGQGNNRKVVY